MDSMPARGPAWFDVWDPVRARGVLEAPDLASVWAAIPAVSDQWRLLAHDHSHGWRMRALFEHSPTGTVRFATTPTPAGPPGDCVESAWTALSPRDRFVVLASMQWHEYQDMGVAVSALGRGLASPGGVPGTEREVQSELVDFVRAHAYVVDAQVEFIAQVTGIGVWWEYNVRRPWCPAPQCPTRQAGPTP